MSKKTRTIMINVNSKKRSIVKSPSSKSFGSMVHSKDQSSDHSFDRSPEHSREKWNRPLSLNLNETSDFSDAGIVTINASMIDSDVDYNVLSYDKLVSSKREIDQFIKKTESLGSRSRSSSSERKNDKLTLSKINTSNDMKNEMISKLPKVRFSVQQQSSSKNQNQLIQTSKQDRNLFGDKKFRASLVKRSNEIELIPISTTPEMIQWILKPKDQSVFQFEFINEDRNKCYNADFPMLIDNQVLFEKQRLDTKRNSIGVNIDWSAVDSDIRNDFKRRSVQPRFRSSLAVHTINLDEIVEKKISSGGR